LVRAALRAAADRCAALRRRALDRACFANARGDAALLPSRRNARLTAAERRRDVLRFVPARPFDASRAA
jgi:hypothetical protein